MLGQVYVQCTKPIVFYFWDIEVALQALSSDAFLNNMYMYRVVKQ